MSRSIPMKTFFLALFFVATVSWSAEPWMDDYAALLKKYARPDGVKYGAWKANAADVAALEAVCQAIAKNGPAGTSRADQLAYYINAYNAWMIREVLQKYPISSIRDIAPLFGVFTQDRITVAGKKMSLNKLEKEIIIKQFGEPRIHFAVNCASRSCPPLATEPMEGAKLNDQLNVLTTRFLNTNPLGIKVGGDKAEVSKIFEWYADDFKSSGGTLAFINLFRKDKLPAETRIVHQDYDWALNEAL